MERIKSGIVMKHKETGEAGVTVSDDFGVCSSSETPVVFDGTNVSLGVETENLEVVGPEEAVSEYEKCGGGQKEKCCIFLVFHAGLEKFICARFGPLRNDLIFRRMVSQRHPAQLYPNCQLTLQN